MHKKRNTISIRIRKELLQDIDEYAKKYNLNRLQAVNRMILYARVFMKEKNN